MSTHPSTSTRPAATSTKRAPWTFFVLVFILSIPFGVLGAFSDISFPKALGLNIPISGLMLVCPLTAAVILVYREERLPGVGSLLQRVFDLKRVKHKIWYLPTFLLMPLVMVLLYGVLRLTGQLLPEPHNSLLIIPILFVAFFIGAIGEEVGWTGYATDPLQARWNAIGGAFIVGSVWALWHTVTYIEARNAPPWIVAQTLGTILLRIFIVWLYNNTGKSLFVAISFHDMVNVSESMFGPQYNPVISLAIMSVIAALVVFFWGPKTLAHFRYARRRER
ncbi:MAG TPA: CPBP family intramembrane glutamic endopeptidase [Ktedonobacterales bacterium]